MEPDTLKVKFTHSNTVKEKKPYTIYEIEVRASATISWVIYKRFSHFTKLHEHISQINIGASKLPPIPPKRLTNQLATEFVEKRKNELERYLRAMIAIPRVVQSEIMQTFLEIPDSARPMLFRISDHPNVDVSSPVSTQTDSLSVLENMSASARTTEDKHILDLIIKLKSNPNKVAVLLSFGEWFFTLRPKLTPDQIRFLFQGRTNHESDGGILQTCGDFKQSRIASRTALQLISRLLDVERNRECAMFESVFCTLPSSILQKMRLHVHILSERSSRLLAFKIIAVLVTYQQKLLTTSPAPKDMKMVSNMHKNYPMVSNTTTATIPANAPELQILETVLRDDWARSEFIKWYYQRSDALSVLHTDISETSSFNTPVSILCESHTSVAQHGFEDLLRILETNIEWHIVNTNANSHNLFSSPFMFQPESTNMNMNMNINTTNTQTNINATNATTSTDDDHNQAMIENRQYWTIGNGGIPNNNRQNIGPLYGNSTAQAEFYYLDKQVDLQIKLSYLNDKQKDSTISRITALLPYNVKSVWELLYDTSLTTIWNLHVHSCKVVTTLDATTDIIHMIYKSFSSPYKFFDFCLLRSVRRMKDGGIAILYKSVTHSSCPESNFYIRSNILVGGYIITPVRYQDSKTVCGCLLTNILELDKDSVLIISSNLLGEDTTMVESIKNIGPLLSHIKTAKKTAKKLQAQQLQLEQQIKVKN